VKSVRFVPAARREFLAEVVYYNQEQAGLGARFAAAVEEAAARALAFPFAGSPAAAATRRVFLLGFPFSVVYREVAAGIVIFALAHQSRRPDYWATRVQDR
jgi:plasmid stabilization system protein ParE